MNLLIFYRLLNFLYLNYNYLQTKYLQYRVLSISIHLIRLHKKTYFAYFIIHYGTLTLVSMTAVVTFVVHTHYC